MKKSDRLLYLYHVYKSSLLCLGQMRTTGSPGPVGLAKPYGPLIHTKLSCASVVVTFIRAIYGYSADFL